MYHYQPYQPMLSEFAQTIHTPPEISSVAKTSDHPDQEVTHLTPSPSPSDQPPTAPLATPVIYPGINYPEPEPAHILVALLHANDVPYEACRISGDYKRLFEKLFRAAIDAYDVYVTFELKVFDMSRGEFPALEEINKFYGLMVVGAAVRISDPYPWIQQLVDRLSQALALTEKQWRHKNIVGFGFGHHLIGSMLGAKVKRGAKSWEVGLTELSITDEGKEKFTTKNNVVRIRQFHHDYLASLPEHFTLLATSHPPRSPIQIMASNYPPSLKAGFKHCRFLTMECHPEMTPTMLSELVFEAQEEELLSELFYPENGWGYDQTDSIWLAYQVVKFLVGGGEDWWEGRMLERFASSASNLSLKSSLRRNQSMQDRKKLMTWRDD